MADKKITDLTLISSITSDLSFPVDDGIATYRATPLQLFDYLRPKFSPLSDEISNLSLDVSVSSSALTIAVKTQAGANPSAGDKVRVAFRSATLTSGAFNLRTIESARSLTISSGSTLGMASSKDHYVWVYLLDNAGTLELAASLSLFSELSTQSTTAEGGAGGADSGQVMYSQTARSNVPIRVIARMKVNQSTAGTYAVVPTEVALATTFDRDPMSMSYSGTNATSVGTSFSTVTFNTQDHDSHNVFSLGAATILSAGRYLVAVTFDLTSNASNNFYWQIDANGSVSKAGGTHRFTASMAQSLGYSRVLNLSAGDVLRVNVAADTAGVFTVNNSIGTSFNILKVA